MSESKAKLQAEVERTRNIVRAVADLLEVAADCWERIEPEELNRMLEPLRAAFEVKP